ncbi:S-methyl-5-thioribose-1-phosphate isomerase [Nocardia rhizosphaerae]|uniref:Methylthioribose-1-phosphate isomerase n=1 Tax=Nocardia rhizosphaerae TaxID=1691571 RepID=A0ABV8L3F3_9NOCA
MDDSSLTWDEDDGVLVTIDQRGLPHEVRELRLGTVNDVIGAIATLAIRGAPAIGIAGAFGVALAARANPGDVGSVWLEADRLAAARPTAVNLAWAVERVRSRILDGADAMLAEALDLLAEDGRVNLAAATNAADLVQQLCGEQPLRLLTHCNTGRLATSAFGTAIGALRILHQRGAVADVLVGETRPLLQGARLTAWELAEAGIPHRLTIDSAAAWAMATGQVDAVLVGADRITANGDVANKIGTFALALAARHHDIPFVVVAPESTRDTTMATGARVIVEERIGSEVTRFGGVATAPAGTKVFNPAFDVTPADLITAVITENGVIYQNSEVSAAAVATEPAPAQRAPASPRDPNTGDDRPAGADAAAPAGADAGAPAGADAGAPAGADAGAPAGADAGAPAPTSGSGYRRVTGTMAREIRGKGAAIATIARQLHHRGWMPGTAGNISVRIGDDALITGSGLSKGALREDDTVLVTVADTMPWPGQRRKPSAETSIHTAVYRTRAAGAVVHVHSPFATALATTATTPGDAVTTLPISGYELLKGFGLADPSEVAVPVFPNWTEVARIGADIETYLRENPSAPPVLCIHGHGITAWGDTLTQARDRAECLEALCELITRTGRTAATPLEIG